MSMSAPSRHEDLAPPPGKVICYQYRADRGRRALQGIDEQVGRPRACCAPVADQGWVKICPSGTGPAGMPHAARSP
jgi:hypothetical protein